MNKTVKILLSILIIIVVAVAAYFITYSVTTYFLDKQNVQEQHNIAEYTVGDQKIHTMICEINNEFELEVPDTFTKMDEETLETKYPLESRPGLVYTNDEANINVAISITTNEMTDDQIEQYLEVYRGLFGESETIDLIRCETVEQNGMKTGRVEMITPAVDTNIYNNMCFFQIDNKQVIVSFNCKESQMEDWKDMSNVIINSIKLMEN